MRKVNHKKVIVVKSASNSNVADVDMVTKDHTRDLLPISPEILGIQKLTKKGTLEQFFRRFCFVSNEDFCT